MDGHSVPLCPTIKPCERRTSETSDGVIAGEHSVRVVYLWLAARGPSNSPVVCSKDTFGRLAKLLMLLRVGGTASRWGSTEGGAGARDVKPKLVPSDCAIKKCGQLERVGVTDEGGHAGGCLSTLEPGGGQGVMRSHAGVMGEVG